MDRALPFPQARYSRGAMLLHWTIAAALAFELGLGWRMDDQGAARFAVFQLHKSVGITILLLTVARLGWRLAHPAPAFPVTTRIWERRLAHLTHIAFYILLFALPLSGWLMVSTAKLALPTLLYGAIPWPHFPGTSGLVPTTRARINDAADLGHHVAIYSAYALIALHVAGALKHQFVDRGEDMARMLPAPDRRLAIATILVVLAVAAFAAIGNRLPLGAPLPVAAPAPSPVVVAAPVALPPPVAAPAVEKAPVVAAEAPADPAPATPRAWKVAQQDSAITFSTAYSQGAVTGRFARWSAKILFAPDALDRSSVAVSVDMASVTTADADAQSALPGDSFLAVATHPTATFEARRFRHIGGDRYEARGTLSLRGVARPLTLPFTLAIDGDRATMTAKVAIDRMTFGIGQGQWATTDDLQAGVTIDVRLKATAGG